MTKKINKQEKKDKSSTLLKSIACPSHAFSDMGYSFAFTLFGPKYFLTQKAK